MGCDCATARLLVVADTAGPDAPKRGWGGEQGRQIKRLPRLTNPRARTTRRAGLLLLLLLALMPLLVVREVPVMAILKEFREMAGAHGRQAHRPAEPSTYEYEKHRIDPSKGASSSTM